MKEEMKFFSTVLGVFLLAGVLLFSCTFIAGALCDTEETETVTQPKDGCVIHRKKIDATHWATVTICTTTKIN